MPLNVLVMPDKFKGTLTATAAAEAIAAGWQRARPADRLTLFPISDGGDGFGELIGRALRADLCWTDSVNAAHEPHRTAWWWSAESQTAIIESAQVIGLALLPPGKHHPFDLDTFGLGAVIRAATERRARRVLIGIGGSATNDGGFGLARSLGWRFLDSRGRLLDRWTQLDRLAHLDPPVPASNPLTIPTDSAAPTLEVAVDVANPLLGERGATRVYGPQKGLTPADVPVAEACLGQLAKIVAKQGGRDYSAVPGTGAAGGLGFCLLAFAGASLKPGFELFAQTTHLSQRLACADLVITGEGAIDRSSLMGKGVGELLKRCQQRQLPCIGLAGVVDRNDGPTLGFTRLHGLTPDLTTPEEAQLQAAHWLAQLAELTAR